MRDVIAVVCPVLWRPERMRPFVENVLANTRADKATDCMVVFAVSPSDTSSVVEARLCQQQLGYKVTSVQVDGPYPGDYARKVNRAVREWQYVATWLLTAADDLEFVPGWDDAVRATHERTGALVIGTNDLGNPKVKAGEHATHSMVHRDYVKLGTVDDPTRLLHEGYQHNWVDNEFVQTAMHRGQWAFAADAHVRHLHPVWGHGQMDATYTRGQADYHADRELFKQRRHLWGGGGL